MKNKVSFNNWYNFDKSKGFKTLYTTTNSPSNSFRQELSDAAKLAADYAYPDRLSFLFSGGLESELLLRSFLSIGYRPDIYIFRYENDINLYDVSYAITLCESHCLKYKLIDFNLNKFFNNDALEIVDKAQIDRPRALPYCKFLELVDGVPILARGEPNLILENSNWIQRCHEYDVGRIIYANHIGIKAIPEWFKWTPGLVISFLETQWARMLVNNKLGLQTDIHATKIVGYKETYNDLIFRSKKTGMEGIDCLIQDVEAAILQKNKTFLYRRHFDRKISFWYSELTGRTY